MSYGILADVVVVMHALYVGFVVLGLIAVLVGYALDWRWIRNRCFRLLHLAAIALVCVESILGIDCPLTTLENGLRVGAGANGYRGDFMGYWLDRLIFFDFPPWMFTILYLAFGFVVLATMWLAPIQGMRSRMNSPTDR